MNSTQARRFQQERSAPPRVEPLESERNFQRNDAGLMRELEVRTLRVRRGWIDRLKGYYRLYETKVTDGERVATERAQPAKPQNKRHYEIGMPSFTTSTITIARWSEHLVRLSLSGTNITLEKDSGVVPVIPIREGFVLG